MAKRELMADVSGERVRGRPRLGLMAVKVAFAGRSKIIIIIRRQRDDRGGCASMREREEEAESPGAYVGD